jgi:hypothetical protein
MEQRAEKLFASSLQAQGWEQNVLDDVNRRKSLCKSKLVETYVTNKKYLEIF